MLSINGDGGSTPDDRQLSSNPNPEFSSGQRQQPTKISITSIFLYDYYKGIIYGMAMQNGGQIFASQSDGGRSKNCYKFTRTRKPYCESASQKQGGSFGTNLAPNDYYMKTDLI